ncbi:MAG: purine-nucleoside phosphorylase [Streptococcaceae bacterium]|jgi:purine-nucleoside phosphorylase|nr:purine-nucleoside phosphorylase [Streptococcaceae bacterium]
MPTPHIEAQKGEIAERVLLPGDPLRAKFIAENFLENAKQFNSVRGMLGFTGSYKGEKVSVMGTGMGIPSISIYAHELIAEYGAKKLIRVGTAGSLNANVKIRDLVIAQAAATTSSIVRNDYPQFDLPMMADFGLLDRAYHTAEKLGMTSHVGGVLSSDLFYGDIDQLALGKLGFQAVEMEAAGLYYLGAKHQVATLAIMTISDSLVTGEETTSEERQATFTDMMQVGLETLLDER